MSSTFGSYFKELRTKKGRTLRRFCELHGFDPGNISRLERGVFPLHSRHVRRKAGEVADGALPSA